MTIDQVVPKPTNIHEALSRAKIEIGVIGKDDENQFHHYKFRGIDAIVNSVGPVFARLGIVVAPVHRLVSSEEVTSTEQKKGFRVIVETVWTFSISTERTLLPDKEGSTFTVPATSAITAQTLGEAIDYSDKALNQAQTQSFKNALAQVLTIPTGEEDPDATSPEAVPEKTTGELVLEGLAGEGFNKTKAKKYAAEALTLLELKHPIPNARVDDVIRHATELRDEAEKPLEDDGEDDSREGYE